MKKFKWSKIFALCMGLLLITTFAPSFAVADSEDNYIIEILPGSENREITKVNGVFLQGTEIVPSLTIPVFHTFINVSGNNFSIPKRNINSNEDYKLILSIKYIEDSQKYHYFDEIIMTGEQLLTKTEFVIPNTNLLKISDINRNYNDIHFSVTYRIGTDRRIEADEFFVSSNPLVVPLGLEALKDNKRYWLTSELTVGDNLDYESILETSSEISFEGFAEDIHFRQPKTGIHFYFPVSTDLIVQLSNDKYQIDLTSNHRWHSSYEITNDEVLRIPTQLSEIKIEKLNRYRHIFDDLLELVYTISLNSDQFSMSSIPSNFTINYELYDEEKSEIVSWVNNRFSGSESISTTNLKEGDYVLKTTLSFDDKHLSAQTEFNFRHIPKPGEPDKEVPGDNNGPISTPPSSDPDVVNQLLFEDIENHWAKKEIEALASMEIILGKTEVLFKPEIEISRAEFAVLLARALELPNENYEGIFHDVNENKRWAFAGIEAAVRAGIIYGMNNQFNPDAPITREEIAAMVIRAIEYHDKEKLVDLPTISTFNDHDLIGAFAIEAIYKANALGIVRGNEGSSKPKDNATRAEAAVMLYRVLDILQMLE